MKKPTKEQFKKLDSIKRFDYGEMSVHDLLKEYAHLKINNGVLREKIVSLKLEQQRLYSKINLIEAKLEQQRLYSKINLIEAKLDIWRDCVGLQDFKIFG